MRKSGKIKVLAGLLALMLITGTFAFFQKEMSIENFFSTKKYGGELVEKFTPETEWEPGGKVTKEVQAVNTGNYPLYVRIRFEEEWERKGTKFDVLSSVKDKGKFFPTSASTEIVENSSVYKHLINVGESKNDAKWIQGSDGYFYYAGILEAGKATEKLMDYVVLCNNADMGSYIEKFYYAIVDEDVTADKVKESDYKELMGASLPSVETGKVLYQKKIVTLDEKNAGYADADYTLTVVVELLQANKDAASENGWVYIPEE